MGGGGQVLVVDDDPSVGQVLSALLKQAGFLASHVTSGREALDHLAREPVDVLITDLMMPGMDGMELLSRLSRERSELPVVMLTAHGTVSNAVEAMKRGATEFLLKPFDREEVIFCIEKAMAAAEHAAERPPAQTHETRLVGQTEAMRALDDMLTRVAASDTTVLITGETGTGKELAAAIVHERSRRREGPFIATQCAALPGTLLESELFGYRKGAFTGATRDKPGRVALAEGGTLFLDEIGELPLGLQAKLLRLLQEREYQPVGGTRTVRADVRFVAATHRDLEAMVAEGTFREDLFYRLSVVPVRMPALRDRIGDIPILAKHFWTKHCASAGREGLVLRADALLVLTALEWPGNVRQLENLLERLVILSDGPEVGEGDVRAHTTRSSRPSTPENPDDLSLDGRVRAAERQALVEALSRANKNRTVAARLLGVSRRTLYNKLAEHDLADV